MKNPIFINLFDIYGSDLKINISGQEKVKTLFGSLIGFISISLIATVILFQICNIFRHDVKSVIYNESQNHFPVNNLSHIPMMFSVVDVIGKTIPWKGLYSIDPFYLKYVIEKDENNNTKSSTKSLPLKLQPCDRNIHLGSYKTLFENFDVENYFCIEPGKYNLTLYGTFGDLVNGYSLLSAHVSKCDNKTEVCYDEEIISKKLNGVVLLFVYVGYQIDNYNYYQPNQLKIQTASYLFTYNLLKRWVQYITPVTYETDYGFFFEDKQKENFYMYHSTFLDVDYKSPNVINTKSQITSFSLRNTENSRFYYRSYIKFSTVVAYAGGVVKFIMTISGLVNYLFTHNNMVEKISKILFAIDEVLDGKFVKINKKNKNLENLEIFDKSEIVPNLNDKPISISIFNGAQGNNSVNTFIR
jgi:hypothetical protein